MNLISQLERSDWAFMDHFIDDSLIERLIQEQQELFDKGAFRPAGIRKTGEVSQNIRSDEIAWWDPVHPSPLQQSVWEIFESLRLELNRKFFLGLTHFECHYARYAQGSHYDRHLDQMQGSASRVVSLILYLNRDWDEKRDGGALRIFNADGSCQEIAPHAGRAACFLSDVVEHEVLAPHRQRLSLTGWFRRDGVRS